jgi:hypothetical protein
VKTIVVLAMHSMPPNDSPAAAGTEIEGAPLVRHLGRQANLPPGEPLVQHLARRRLALVAR